MPNRVASRMQTRPVREAPGSPHRNGMATQRTRVELRGPDEQLARERRQVPRPGLHPLHGMNDRGDEAPRAGVAARIPTAQRVDLDAGSRVRRVDEAPAADVE